MIGRECFRVRSEAETASGVTPVQASQYNLGDEIVEVNSIHFVLLSNRLHCSQSLTKNIDNYDRRVSIREWG